MKTYPYTVFLFLCIVRMLSVPEADNPTGCYRNGWKVPGKWENQKLVLYFGGVSSAVYTTTLNAIPHESFRNNPGYHTFTYRLIPFNRGWSKTFELLYVDPGF